MTPALVLGEPSPTTLAVIRSLGRKGITTFTVAGQPSYVTRSRWHQPLPGERGFSTTPASLARLLSSLDAERMALIPCSDSWMRAVAALDPGLAARFPASQASPATIEVLLDKGRFAAAMRDLGLPHPRTECVEPADADLLRQRWVLEDAFLKPRDSEAFRTRFGVKARRFGTVAEATSLVAEAARTGLALVLQEYIPGPPTHHYMIEGFVDRTSAVRARFARRRLRMHPTDFGDSVFMVSVPLSAVGPAVETLDRLFEALRYRGVFEAEFKYDARDGLFKLLEVNARPWGFLALAARCGVDVCTMAYRDALGLAVDAVVDYEVGRYCVHPAGQWRLVREGLLNPWDWGRSLLGATQLVLCADDPLPAVADGARWLLGKLRRPRGTRAHPNG